MNDDKAKKAWEETVWTMGEEYRKEVIKKQREGFEAGWKAGRKHDYDVEESYEMWVKEREHDHS